MKTNHSIASRNRRQGERGVALVITLLLLILMIALTLAMVIATSSDTLINHYYRNFRSSFYAADSGLNIARGTIQSKLQADITNPVVLGTPPLTSGANGEEGIVQTYIQNTFGQGYTSINAGLAGNSWPGKFKITNAVLSPSTCTVSYIDNPIGSLPSNAGPYTCANPPTGTNVQTISYSYNYPYTLTAVGQSMANEAVTVQDSGSVVVNVVSGAASSNVSFAYFGTFLEQYPGWPNCGNPFAYGTLSGPIFTNQGWTLGSGGAYTFTNTLQSVAPDIYWNYGDNNRCDDTNKTTDKQGSQTIAPNFQAGISLGQTALPLPANDFNQKEAVVDKLGNSWSGYTTSQQDAAMSTVLKDVNGNPYPAAGTSNPGVYLPYTVSGSTATFTGGGIYVEGDANVTVTASTSGGHNLQVFTISQAANGTPTTINGSPNVSSSNSGGYTTTTTTTTATTVTPTTSTTTTVTIDLTAGTTSMSSAATTSNQSAYTTTTTTTKVKNSNGQVQNGYPQTSSNSGTNPTTQNTTNASLSLAGEPENLTPTLTGGQQTEGAMLYVDGNINSLSGPSSGAAIQNTSAVTITAADNINITGNITYATEPVTTTQNQIPNTPADTLIPGNNNGQVLGLFTANGNILFNVPNSGQNLEIDASLAAVSNGGSGAVYNGGNAINTVNIIGGRIANTTNNCNCNQRNIYFDQRFTAGLAPPWFPSTTITTSTPTTGTATLSVQRTNWVDVTAW